MRGSCAGFLPRRPFAAVAIQKLALGLRLLDCFGAKAPRNDGARSTPATRLALALIAFALLAPHAAQAQVEVEIRRGQVRAIPIAIAEFAGPGIGQETAQIVTADLERSGLFKPINPAAFIDRMASVDAPPSFQDWKVLNAQALVVGRVTDTGDGRLGANTGFGTFTPRGRSRASSSSSRRIRRAGSRISSPTRSTSA